MSNTFLFLQISFFFVMFVICDSLKLLFATITIYNCGSNIKDFLCTTVIDVTSITFFCNFQ